MQDLKKAEQALRKRLAILTHRMEDIDQDLRDHNDDDFSEMATEREDDEVLETVGIMADNEVQQIQLALSRIKLGSYGICQGCGIDIPPARLAAVPHAALCIDCAEA
jgi:RNA polymerase-binding transcription factor DksA